MALGAHLHATWDILAFVPNGPGPKSKQALMCKLGMDILIALSNWNQDISKAMNANIVRLH